jgi:nicotinate phosphoribosyltransferase
MSDAPWTPNSSALFTDFYSLTMAYGYWKERINHRAVFEMFFRRQPFGSGFAIFAGLEDLLDRIAAFHYSQADIAYLRGLAIFDEDFLDYLSRFRFSGSIWAMDEGSAVFPHEPLIRVDGSLIECQLLEGMLLNTVNFQSLIATKTARVYLASGKGFILEFGLRRAQGPDGAMSASRAAFIGGAGGTSNTLAGKLYGMPALGTMAHAWVMSFPSEEDAFRAYARIYPDRAVFLIDTYDTLKSGTPNAIKVGRELVDAGRNFGVRLDSGDIHYLSVEVRKMLDQAGFPQATITVSNDLDEQIIHTLREAGAPIDFWGVGTQMVTGGTEAAFTGVYKLAAREDAGGRLIPAIKFSDNPEKTTNPGIKQVWRIKDPQGMAVADVLTLVDEQGEEILEKKSRYAFWHPSADYRHFYHEISGSAEKLLKLRMEQGRILTRTTLAEIRERVNRDLDSLDPSYKRLLNPHVYKVSITGRLRELKLKLIQDYLGDL